MDGGIEEQTDRQMTLFVCLSPGFGGVQVPREFCEETVTTDTSLAMLLPAVKGLGVCSFALLQYLATMQNNFMEEYSRLTGQR